MLRILLFLFVNMLAGLLFGSVLSLLKLSIFSLYECMMVVGLFGMVGSVLSLYSSNFIALSVVHGKVISSPSSSIEDWLLKIIYNQSIKLDIVVPRLVIYNSLDMNAFTTGFRKHDSIVAVSTGLIENMSRTSIEAVIAHELQHIISGDMITMTLLQGSKNIFVVFISHYLTRLIMYWKLVLLNNVELNNIKKNCDNDDRYDFYSIDNSLIYIILSLVLELFFGLIANVVIFWFSRYREFYADAGAAKLVGGDKMISALQELQYDIYVNVSRSRANLRTLYINVASSNIVLDSYSVFLDSLFASHPPLKKRIEALQKGIYLN